MRSSCLFFLPVIMTFIKMELPMTEKKPACTGRNLHFKEWILLNDSDFVSLFKSILICTSITAN